LWRGLKDLYRGGLQIGAEVGLLALAFDGANSQARAIGFGRRLDFRIDADQVTAVLQRVGVRPMTTGDRFVRTWVSLYGGLERGRGRPLPLVAAR
jgi:hypothetical protein